MKHYNITNVIERINPETGEFEHYKQVNGFKRVAKKGWNMTYNSFLEEVVCSLKGEKETRIMFWIFRQFKASKLDILLSQSKIAKYFQTTQPYVSKVINKLINLEVLLVSRSEPKKRYYRLNPYLYIPPGARAIELQDEWDILTGAPKKIKDKFEYLSYLQSDEWNELKNKIIDRDKHCKLCGSTSNLEIHHLTYDNLYEENLEDLQCLCNRCHENIHKEK
jgi:hypothetical protein